MPQANITYFGQKVTAACDGNCAKAWGVSQRPEIQLSGDPDDTVLLADGELGIAPTDPGTYEGGHGKPLDVSGFPNKWCVRECERSTIANEGETLELPNWNVRQFNMPWLHRKEEIE